MATVQVRTDARGRKRYRAILRKTGYPTESRTFSRLRDARSWASDLESTMDCGEYTRTSADNTKMADLIERYIATICRTKKTGHRQAQQLREWKKQLGNFPVKSIHPRNIATARDNLAAGRAPATVARYLAALSHVFTLAVKDWQVAADNPVRSIIWPREPRGRVRFLSDPERARLLDASRKVGLFPLVSVAIMTGCRRGELVGLTWSAVDFKRRRLILLETKNDERRRVPLMPAAFEIVRGLHESARNRAGGALVFGLTDNQVTTRWRRALWLAGIDDFRFHDLRHTAASYLAMSGATTNEIAEILGHKTLSMVKRYAHLTESHSARVLEKMGERMLTENHKPG
jgi:integrase